MKKQILNLGKSLNKIKQKSINGGGTQSCPPTNCYYGNSDTELFGGAVYCGSCGDYNNLPSSCQNKVRVGYYCFGI